MQVSLPYLYGQLEYLEKNLSLLKKTIIAMPKKQFIEKKLYGSLPKTDLTFTDFKIIRKDLSSSWEHEWK